MIVNVECLVGTYAGADMVFIHYFLFFLLIKGASVGVMIVGKFPAFNL